MSKILIGRPLLKAIGFDLETHLETNRDVLNNSTLDTNLLNTVNTRSFGKAARSSYTGLEYNTADSDPVPPTETAGAAMGTDSASEIQDAIERMIASAKLNGMSSVGLTRARELLQDFREIFRIRLGSDQHAKIPPLKVQLKPHFAPVKDTQRWYAPAQRAFLSTTMKKLESLGAVRANPTSLWASPALAVPKAGSEGYRFTVELRRENAKTEPTASSMPHLESMFQSVQGSRCYAKIDILATRPCRLVAGDFLNSNAGRHLHTDSTNTRQHRRRELFSRSSTTAFPRTSGAQTSSTTMAR
jgi:hypothetical protein